VPRVHLVSLGKAAAVALALTLSLDSSFLARELKTEFLELVYGFLSYVLVLSKQRVVVLVVLVLTEPSITELAS
jgi:hypothetical protein